MSSLVGNSFCSQTQSSMASSPFMQADRGEEPVGGRLRVQHAVPGAHQQGGEPLGTSASMASSQVKQEGVKTLPLHLSTSNLYLIETSISLTQVLLQCTV